MIAITACAAALAAVTEGLLLRSGYEKKHFVTDQYEIESPKLPDGAAFRCVFLLICMIMCMERTMSRWWQRSAHSSRMRC